MSSRYGIVGSGRVATHFAHYLNLLNLPYAQWSRRAETASGIGLKQTLRDSDVVLLLLSDSAIEKFLEENSFLREKTLFHFSGSLSIPGVYVAHPPMTFGHPLYDLATYQSIPFLLEDSDWLFKECFPDFKNPVFLVDPRERPYIHALCVLAGNFTSILWDKYFSEMKNKFNISAESLHPYLWGIFKNLEVDHRKALTGPLSRGDEATIAKNLAALMGDPFQKVYQSFVSAVKEQQERACNFEENSVGENLKLRERNIHERPRI